MFLITQKSQITARNKHQCFLCKRDFDHEEENAFLEMFKTFQEWFIVQIFFRLSLDFLNVVNGSSIVVHSSVA